MTAYLDHAATTPVNPAALAAWQEVAGTVGNASSLHSSGRAARRIVEESREAIAAAVNARPGEVVLTAGGTEADNLAIKGLFWSRRTADPRRRRILASAVEHHAVLDPVQWLADHHDADVTWLPVDAQGRLDLPASLAEIERDPESIALVTVMWANNEVGTVQPVAEVVAAAHAHGIPVHTDAVQAVGQLDVDVTATGPDCLALSGHKLGAPTGSGALIVRHDVALVAVQHGGGQERGVRSGTLDVAGARALAVAVTAAVQGREDNFRRLTALRADLRDVVLAAVPDAVVHGQTDPAGRLPGLLHVTIPGCEGDSLLYLLDAQGVECSTGSACQAGVPRPSHVLRAIGIPEDQARGALRFSLGHTSTAADVQRVAEVLPGVVARARAARSGSRVAS